MLFFEVPLSLFIVLPEASAQGTSTSTLTSFQKCLGELAALESEASALEARFQRSRRLYHGINDAIASARRRGTLDEHPASFLNVELREITGAYDFNLRLVQEVRQDIKATRLLCEYFGADVASRRFPGAGTGNARRPTAADLQNKIGAAQRKKARAAQGAGKLDQRIAELRRKIIDAGINESATGAADFASRFSAIADFGLPITQNQNRRFDAFSQTLEESANNGWYGSLGVQAETPAIFDGPLARVWFTAAATMFYLNTKLNRVTNDGGGQVSSSGDDLLRGAALLGGFGGRFWPDHPFLGRWEWQLLGGVGYALNSIRGVGPAGGEQFSGSEHVTPWLARFALYYSITDNLKAGLALSLITTPEITGQLPSGAQFQIGRMTNYIAAISMVYSFYTASQGRYLPSLQ